MTFGWVKVFTEDVLFARLYDKSAQSKEKAFFGYFFHLVTQGIARKRIREGNHGMVGGGVGGVGGGGLGGGVGFGDVG